MAIGHPSIRQPFSQVVSDASRRFNMFRAGTDFTLAQCALACKQALTENGKRAYDVTSFERGVALLIATPIPYISQIHL